MPESRDRLSRAQDIAEIFSRRRQLVREIGDEERTSRLFGSPRTTVTTDTRGPIGIGAIRAGRGSFGTPRNATGRGRNVYGSASVGRENTPATAIVRRGRGRPTNSLLPSWYPRTPLRDITAVVRAIERRRARLIDNEGQEIESPSSLGPSILNPTVPGAGAQLEHENSLTTPHPTVAAKPHPPFAGKVPKILLGIANETCGESEFLTPQKKLLNSIDKVEKVVMEELRNLKRTPVAKKAEREKRVRTLMSMR